MRAVAGLSAMRAVALGLCLAAWPAPASGQASPLADFGALVVGAWEDEGSRHVHEWGVGQRVITSKSYTRSADAWQLVSEGMWFWDPTEDAIRGVVVALGMPVELFEYRSEVRGRDVVHSLFAHGQGGGRFVERWRFVEGAYAWTLEQVSDGSVETLMGGRYRMVPGVLP